MQDKLECLNDLLCRQLELENLKERYILQIKESTPKTIDQNILLFEICLLNIVENQKGIENVCNTMEVLEYAKNYQLN